MLAASRSSLHLGQQHWEMETRLFGKLNELKSIAHAAGPLGVGLLGNTLFGNGLECVLPHVFRRAFSKGF